MTHTQTISLSSLCMCIVTLSCLFLLVTMPMTSSWLQPLFSLASPRTLSPRPTSPRTLPPHSVSPRTLPPCSASPHTHKDPQTLHQEHRFSDGGAKSSFGVGHIWILGI